MLPATSGVQESPLAQSLRLLMVEDSEPDAVLLQEELRRQGFRLQFERVADERTLRAALAREWDLVLADYAMPGFGALRALAVARDCAPDVPVIVVSGSVGDAELVAAMRAGAADYVFKDNLSRLAAAIRRELADAATNRARRAAARAHREAEARAVEALQRSEERFRLVAKVTSDVLWDWDLATQRIAWTEGLRGWGYDPETSGQDDEWWQQCVHPEDLPSVRERLRESVERHTSWEAEYRFRRADGTFAQVYDRGYIVRSPDGTPLRMIGAMMDISERRRLELQLVQAQKMEAVGRLAGGVAHDFNNVITAISGYAALAARKLEPASPVRHYLDEISKAGDRAAAVTRQLLAFSRKQILQPRVLDLRQTVDDLQHLLHRLIGEDIDLVVKRPASLGRVRADPTQIDQVLMNLAINARDAMGQGGRLIVETADVVMDRTSVRQGVSVAAGRYVQLSVSDTGHGMDEETQSRVFEPFFTTKEVGKGTGLGLATVYGIVKQSGGYVWLYSELGRGTTFKICLPRVDALEEPVAAPPAPSSLPRGAGTLLVVEDEGGVRELLQELLETAGYTVLAADRPSAALRQAEAHEGPIHLLISDVVMPEMTGPDLARRLQELRPGTDVLFLSGYTSGVIAEKGYVGEGHFLQKPFTADALETTVREILGAK